MNETQEKIVVGGQEHTIAVKDITIVTTAPDFNSRIRYPGRMELGPEESLYHMGRVQRFHPRTAGMVAGVFRIKDEKQITPGWCRQAGKGVEHCAGLIDLTLKLAMKGIPVVWIHPESFLHPSAQCGLADVLIELVNNPVKSIEEEERIFADGIAREIIGDEPGA